MCNSTYFKSVNFNKHLLLEKYIVLPDPECVAKIVFVREAPSRKDGVFFCETDFWNINMKQEKSRSCHRRIDKSPT